MRLYLALVVAVLAAILAPVLDGCAKEHAKVGGGNFLANPGPDRFAYFSGTSGTVTIPTGYYVTNWWAHNTSGGGTVVIEPTGPGVYAGCVDAGTSDAGDAGDAAVDAGDAGPCRGAGMTFTIPAATAFAEGIPVLRGAPDELGDGTTFVFTGTDSYWIGLFQYNP
jgi:hypothetical protein